MIPLISFSPYLAQNSPSSLCPVPALSRIQRHRVAPGETIESIAKRYKLIPATLVRLNPSLAQGKVPVGQDILIPPFDGIRVQVPNGATWRDLSTAYGVRADVLFEINGCVPNPKVAFIPGVNWQPWETPRRGDYTGLKSYPLPFVAPIGLGYGWHTNPTTGQSFFHGGVDLLAEPGTPVLAADRGMVIFVAQEGSYGFLVVVDHGNGRQTRYAHLSRFKAKIGQSVQAGDVLGYVGKTGKPDILQPHLHFEVRYKFPVGWVAQDPETHFPKVNP
ncbi:LysM peptidoglycan-binding domain-containing M23 family metallopeptidase [Aphanothece sacrum]|uniref:LysM peptidoglycan-binding domain-containing M23 family metallopeptidase n=1 Tax=Aphanothece sacrum TaxID=1122 RepID=UPI001D131670|nr:M23 family metallopeptidase [Aphanothece sacrum]